MIADNGSVIWMIPSLDEMREACSSTHQVHVEFHPGDGGGLGQNPCCSSCDIA